MPEIIRKITLVDPQNRMEVIENPRDWTGASLRRENIEGIFHYLEYAEVLQRHPDKNLSISVQGDEVIITFGKPPCGVYNLPEPTLVTNLTGTTPPPGCGKMIVQLHWRHPDGSLEFRAQSGEFEVDLSTCGSREEKIRKIESLESIREWIPGVKLRHPVPKGSMWEMVLLGEHTFMMGPAAPMEAQDTGIKPPR